MGLLVVPSELIVSAPEALHASFCWLLNECNAKIDLLHNDLEESVYRAEGIGIPKGRKRFGLLVEELVPNVFIIEIDR